ncbi:cytochrome o ubiquinol oxidase subunit IV [Rhodobacter sp. NTK016B]|uniref:cytochrome o ubiquinol oxidase subunit IV n=1 Tax=Rhodobacter sp. NTK016B TaxID=2759676 RepID=UPI001A8FDCE8|nr:cytochrome o ubiquinol oxidase subunit IV [Rhodobacter sp. NTK016B]MBN8292141.1 cytochrome o ubiquinol oxidase subunit IV [Rhodobacter sp. NTK016B]
MSDPDHRREARLYLAGFGLALTLTLVPFGLVSWGLMQGRALAITIAVLAVAQIVVHLRFFLHIDLSRQKREDLQLILFTVLLLAIMAFGTLWIMGNLATRM